MAGIDAWLSWFTVSYWYVDEWAPDGVPTRSR